MARGSSSLIMGKSMKVSLIWELSMGMVSLDLLMEMYMMENSKITSIMVRESSPLQMVKFIRANSKMGSIMVEVPTLI